MKKCDGSWRSALLATDPFAILQTARECSQSIKRGRTMVKRYDSFVLRRWHCDGERRVDVEHRQSGGQIYNATLTAAIGWIGERCGERPLDKAGIDGSQVGKFEGSNVPHTQPSNLRTFEPYPSNPEL